MIDEKKLTELRDGPMKRVFDADCACDDMPHGELLDTIEALLGENKELKEITENCCNKMTPYVVKLETCHEELIEACKRLLKFNRELCEDLNVSTHYPSAEFAEKAIANAEAEK